MNNTDELIQDIDDILVKNNINRHPAAVYDIAIYIMEREKKVIQSL